MGFAVFLRFEVKLTVLFHSIIGNNTIMEADDKRNKRLNSIKHDKA